MTTHVEETVHGKVLEVRLSGRLTREDYAKFVPDSEELIRQYGKIRVLVVFEDFDGWDAGALWEDIKWDARHFRDVERVALVGEKKWQKWMASICKPFTTGDVRYFEHWQVEDARDWLERE
jgi:hypothetical protein